MNREDRDQFAERWLDEALARYSDAEPRDGFEARILANLAARPVEPVALWRRWVWVPVACAAVMALVVGFSVMRPAERQRPLSVPVTAESKSVQQEIPPVSSANVGHPEQTASAKRRRIRANQQVIAKAAAKTTEPRKPQFAAPALPTEQEQLLASYVSTTPAHELLAVAAEQRAWQDRVQQNAEASRQGDTPQQINHIQTSPLEGGSTEAGAYGTR